MMLQKTIDKILSDEMPTRELLEMLEDRNVFIRANALQQASRRMNNRVLKTIVNFIKNPENQKIRFFGVISLSFLGVLAMFESENEKASKVALQLISLWEDKNEKEELLAFLKSENIDLTKLNISDKIPELQAA